MRPISNTNIIGDLQKINFSLDDFSRLREEDYLYVDKTGMIEEIIKSGWGRVLLFTRPRRFGKSLNLSMLRYFFDMTEDSAAIFEGLYIGDTEYTRSHMNKFPILYLNFKNIALTSFVSAQESILWNLGNAANQLSEKMKIAELKEIAFSANDGSIMPDKLKDLTRILYTYTGKRTIVLIDEYDSVINRAYGRDFWREILIVMKDMFGALFKSNEYLETGVLTGVSRIGKELGFSDMNNLDVYGLTKRRYYEYFGFTESEVGKLLEKCGIEFSEGFYRMYNGYRYGESPFIFNTSSMLKFLDEFHMTGETYLSPYWINTSINNILKENIKKQGSRFKEMLLSLLEGSTTTQALFENVDYDNLHKPAYILSLMVDTGYLCPTRKMGGDVYELRIPNEEVLYGYRDMVDSIIDIEGDILDELCATLSACNSPDGVEKIEVLLNRVLSQVSSYHDFSEKENSYHNFLLGALLFMLGRYEVKSNRESGHGRFDIVLIPHEVFADAYRPIIIEFKVAKEKLSVKEYCDDELLKLAESAIDQIIRMKYYDGFTDKYGKGDFVLIGIGAQGKRCRVSYGTVLGL